MTTTTFDKTTQYAHPTEAAVERLLNIMARLRDPETGCPWDIKQTYASILPHTLEEVYEVAEAIDEQDMSALRDELGDLLLQIIFYAQIAKEDGHFDFAQIVSHLSDKLVRRHPHVFGDEHYANEAEQNAAWEAIKAKERAQKATLKHTEAPIDDFFASLSKALPALKYGQKTQKKAASVGFDWEHWHQTFAKIHEELDEVADAIAQKESQQRIEEEIGDLLFATTNLARHLHVDAENAMRKANRKFALRFNRVREELRRQGKDPDQSDVDEMDRLWHYVKKQLKENKATTDNAAREDKDQALRESRQPRAKEQSFNKRNI